MLAIFYLFVLCLCTPVPADTELKAVTNILGQISAPPSTSTLTERHTIEPLYKIDPSAKPSISFNNKDEILNYERRLANEGKILIGQINFIFPHKKYEHKKSTGAYRGAW